MAKIHIAGLSFRHPGFSEPLLENVHIKIDTSWKSALIGRNGRGKTTLLKLLTGDLIPDNGNITREIEVQYFPYSVTDIDYSALSVLKNALYTYDEIRDEMYRLIQNSDAVSLEKFGELELEYRKMNGYEIEEIIRKESDLMKLNPDLLEQSYRTLSPGEKTRLLLTGLFIRDNIFPLIDEPTNHLDRESRDRVAEYLSMKNGFICVSHDRQLLDSCCDHVISLEKSEVNLVKGTYSQWENQFERKLIDEERRYENIDKESRKLRKAITQRKSWSQKKESEKYCPAADKVNNRGFIGHKAAKMMKQSIVVKNRLQDDLEEQESLLKSKEKRYPLKFSVLPTTRKHLITLDHLQISYDQKEIISDLSLCIRPGMRIVITGENGCGKSSVLKTLTAEVKPKRGNIYVSPEISIIYSAQVPRWKTGSVENHFENLGIDFERARAVLGAVGVVRDIRGKTPDDFSEGEKKMIELCPSFSEPAHVLIWDEPLNYLDISTRMRIESAVLEYQPTMLIVEHDRSFVNKISTDIIQL